MKKISRWYFRLFYHLRLKEKRYYKFIFYLTFCLIIAQLMLTNAGLRKFLVLTEQLEGEPVRIYKSLNHGWLVRIINL